MNLEQDDHLGFSNLSNQAQITTNMASFGRYDVLITDYSGNFSDFLITGKPIMMAPSDYVNYAEDDREVYYDHDSICPALPLMIGKK